MTIHYQTVSLSHALTWAYRLDHMAHDDVIKVRGIHRLPVNSPHNGQWRGALMFSLICVWTNGCANNRDAGDLRCHRVVYDVAVMDSWYFGRIHTYLDVPVSFKHCLFCTVWGMHMLHCFNITNHAYKLYTKVDKLYVWMCDISLRNLWTFSRYFIWCKILFYVNTSVVTGSWGLRLRRMIA